MKVDVYKTKNPPDGLLFVAHGADLPPSIKRPEGVAIKPWKTADFSKSGERIGFTEEERVAVLENVAQHGQATLPPKPKPKRQPKPNT
jgi:hypothetical protein